MIFRLIILIILKLFLNYINKLNYIYPRDKNTRERQLFYFISVVASNLRRFLLYIIRLAQAEMLNWIFTP
jgi:hypothetical protein